MTADPLTATISPDGDVHLPKAVFDRHRWEPGTRLKVELTDTGISLMAGSMFPRTTPQDVFGMLECAGPAKTVEEMDDSVTREIEARRARGRY